MPRLSFRDRFFTPPVGRALFSPLGILLAGAGTAAGIVAGLPIAAAAAVGAAVWAGRVALAVPRQPRPERIDPFTLDDPWRRFVQDALQAKHRFRDAAGTARPGPLRDRLAQIADRVDAGVDECWQVAQRGQALVDARRHVDTAAARRELDELSAERDGGRGDARSSDTLAATAQALEAQLFSARRLDQVIDDARNRLRLLNARLDEAVARVAELSVRADAVADVAGLGADIDGLVAEMEALRQGLDAVSEGPNGTGLPATGTA